jgi:XTP/dITP diphosphohydrolase
MDLVFASSNKNKIREIKLLLPERFNLLDLPDVGVYEEIPEPGATIKENSFLKAQYVQRHLGDASRVIFADDSGLEVDALGGAPGVHSARFAGVPTNDQANNAKLLKEMVNKTDRKARFITVITLIRNNEIYYFEGQVKGTIAHEPRGNNGFGYDPLFIPQGYRSTFAELSNEIKNSISHRGQAVKKLTDFLETRV